ncbi:MAG: DNA polymerase/3'-5' exonuclease PolX [Elusimicrobiales bacterium]|nr:DNA polymerase/3'-5' exonuclease PolX [Elusimicrobiales bacterium]
MATNAAIADRLRAMAALLELDGANPFRVRAYEKAAQFAEGYPEELSSLSREQLTALPHFGPSMAAHITEIAQKDTFGEYEALKKKLPPGLVELVRVQNLGPKRARLLHKNLGIDSVEKLKAAALAGKIRELKGFGEKLETSLLSGAQTAQNASTRMLWWEASLIARDIISKLEGARAGGLEPAGSLRRGRETVGDIDLLCSGAADGGIIERFTALPDVARIIGAGKTKASVLLNSGIQCDLRVIPESSRGAALLYFTGSKEHNVLLRELALSKGYSLNEYGLFRTQDKEHSKPVAGRAEEEIYAKLGLQYIPPELREGGGEIDAAAKNSLPDLLTESDVRGDFHSHTSESDGADSLEEMARAAAAAGWEWAAIGDHTKSLGVAHGLTADRALAGKAALGRLQPKFPHTRLLRSMEVDILKDGSLDFTDEELSQLDVAVASVHSAFRMPQSDMTQRIVKAVSNPNVDILAHPTGGLIGRRAGYTFDLEKVFAAAAANGAALEINGQPERQDLNPVSARRARDMGAKIALSTDAHSRTQYRYMKQAVIVARRAWLEKKDVLNCCSCKELEKWLNR